MVDHGPPPEVLHEVTAASRIPAGFLTFVWIVALALDPDVLVERHEGGSGLAASRRGSSLGADVSALGHLLGESATVAGPGGVFLDQTPRMHPDIWQ